MLSSFTPLAVLLTLTTCVRAASQISLFTDAECRDSYKGLEGPNGYPNGSCTDIRRSGEYGSLQVVGLDPGCAGKPTFPETTRLSDIGSLFVLLLALRWHFSLATRS
jgi:hypothetical protein